MGQTRAATMPILAHMAELRRCIMISGIAMIAGIAVALPFYDAIVSFLYAPLLELPLYDGGEVLYINSITEGLLVRIKLSILTGFILSMPIHLYNVLHFVFPGLLTKEKRILSITLLFSFVFIVGGFFYSYYTILPVSVSFLTGTGFIPANTGILLSFGRNVFYILQFILIAVVVFQIPVILELLLIMNVLKRKAMLKFGRYVIVAFFLLSALITPPDFVTQIGLALPMTALYYLTILIAKMFRFGEE